MKWNDWSAARPEANNPNCFRSSITFFSLCFSAPITARRQMKRKVLSCLSSPAVGPKTFHSMKDKKLSSLSFHSHLAFVGLVLGSLPLCGAMAAAAALNPPKSINPNQPTLFFLFAFVSFLQQKREREMKRQAALASWLACLFFCGARLQQQPLTHKKRKAKKPSQPSRFRRIRRSNLSFISSPIRKSELK